MSDAKRPVLDKTYWAQRFLEVETLEAPLHHVVFKTTQQHWQNIAEKHRAIIARYVGPTENVLDVGCGYGRLCELLPKQWEGWYLGIDFSPNMIGMARALYPARCFLEMNLLHRLNLPYKPPIFQWAIAVSVRGMIIRECGASTWQAMERYIKEVAQRILILEYDTQDEGMVL